MKRFERMVGCKVTPAMFGALQEAAQSSGRTVAELVRVLIEEHLSVKHGRIRGASMEILLEEVAGLRRIVLSLATLEVSEKKRILPNNLVTLEHEVDSAKTLLAQKILARVG